jgi:hypothetical protein
MQAFKYKHNENNYWEGHDNRREEHLWQPINL